MPHKGVHARRWGLREPSWRVLPQVIMADALVGYLLCGRVCASGCGCEGDTCSQRIMLLVEFQFSLLHAPIIIFIIETSTHIYFTLFSLISFMFLIKSLMISLAISWTCCINCLLDEKIEVHRGRPNTSQRLGLHGDPMGR